MPFNTLTFILFFVLVLGAYYSPISWTYRKTILLVSSYIFYSAWNPPLVVLLWFSTVVDWKLASAIFNSSSHSRRRWLLVLSLLANLGLLAYFKYGQFILDNFVTLLSRAGFVYEPLALDIILPIGISFYTFQTLSYTIDVYRKRLKPGQSFLDYALYVTFFPQLVAGPIVRAREFLPQCVEPKKANLNQLGWGLSLLIIGMFQKVILADAILAPTADKVFGSVGQYGTLEAWIGTLAFSGQIFFDFSAYSLCAIGCAMTMGFVLPDNFRFPYGATGFQDFWRRWHISLSTWLRDYLYISLGGNRKGVIRTYINIMFTMLIGGLWHGASWNFVIWGGLHGALLMLERIITSMVGTVVFFSSIYGRLILAIITFIFVSVVWVFFRAKGLDDSITMLVTMFSIQDTHQFLGEEVVHVLLIISLLVSAHIFLRQRTLEFVYERLPWWVVSFVLSFMLVVVVTHGGENNAFIYFQF